jgi:hypothetical protein
MARGPISGHTIEAASLPPAQRNNWYVVRSEIDGATPESVHVIDSVPPPVYEWPATGVENLTSANVVETRAARRGRGERRMVEERWAPRTRGESLMRGGSGRGICSMYPQRPESVWLAVWA